MAALEVEMSVKKGNGIAASTRIDQLISELDQILEELEFLSGGGARAVQTGPVFPPGAEYDPPGGETARDLIEKVEPLLKNGNPECLKYITQLSRIPGSAELIREMDDSYFGVAAEILEELKKTREPEHAK